MAESTRIAALYMVLYVFSISLLLDSMERGLLLVNKTSLIGLVCYRYETTGKGDTLELQRSLADISHMIAGIAPLIIAQVMEIIVESQAIEDAKSTSL